jgi:hypothetical protein
MNTQFNIKSGYTITVSDTCAKLLGEWDASITDVLNWDAGMNRLQFLTEVKDSTHYYRIHRCGDLLVLEIREFGSMYPHMYQLEQDFSEMEAYLSQIKTLAN